MNINIATKEDLLTLKKELVAELTVLIQKENFKREPQEWLKNYEVMKMFNVSKGTLQSFRASGKLTYYRMGKCIYYKHSEIVAILDKSKVSHGPPVGRGYNRFSMNKKP